MNQILQALVNAQRELHNLGKDAQGYGYSYLTLGKLITATRPALTKNGLVVVQTIEPGETTQTLVTTLYHVSGESLSSRYPLERVAVGKANAAQQFGAAISYARRYSLAAMLNISQADDDAACMSDESPATAQPVAPVMQAEAAPATAQAAIRLADCETPAIFSEWLEHHRKKILDSPRGLAAVQAHAEKLGVELPEEMRAVA